MNNYIKKLKNIKDNQDGFSLIELVVAVGILAILSVVGVVAYSKITENARVAAVDAAAAEVLTGAIAYDSNGQDYTQAATEWNNSSNGSITVEATKPNGKDICVVATNVDHDIDASKGADCDSNTGGNTNPDTGGETGGEETTPPVVGSTVIFNFTLYNSSAYGDVVGQVQNMKNGNNEIYSFSREDGVANGNNLDFSISAQDSSLFNDAFNGDNGNINDYYEVYYELYTPEGDFYDMNLISFSCDVVSNDSEATAIYECNPF